ncbi:MAG: M48 family metallopeptidase [Blastocatellia bacterium]
MYPGIAEDKPIDFNKLVELPKLNPQAFQHPWDMQAIEALAKIPMFPNIVQKISSIFSEKLVRLTFTANAVRLGPNQGRSLYKKFEKAAAILDIPKMPEIYLSSELAFNALGVGINQYYLVLFAPLVDALNEEELLAVIGHELGHLKCNHEQYITIAYMIKTFGDAIFSFLPFGVGAAASLGLQLGVLHWYRMAALSCDRAALLVVQNPKVVASTLSKLAGGSRKILPEINLEGILEQAKDYNDVYDSKIERFFKATLMRMETHPFPIIRVKEIMAWANSGAYQKILEGDYPKLAPAAPQPLLQPRLPQAPTAVCPHCQTVVFLMGAFCPSCGGNLNPAPALCAKCNEPTPPGAKFCFKCGSPVGAPAQN